MQKVSKRKRSKEPTDAQLLRERQRRHDRIREDLTGKPPIRAKCGVYIDGWLSELPAVAGAEFAPHIEWQTLCTHLQQTREAADDVLPFIEDLAAGFYFVAVEHGARAVARELCGIVKYTVSKHGSSLRAVLADGKKQCGIWAVVAAAEREAARRGLKLGEAVDIVQYEG